MPVFVIHGSNAVGSHNKLRQILEKYPSTAVARASGSEVTSDFLLNNLQGQGLFDEKRIVILQNPDSDLELEKYSLGEDVSLVLLFDKGLPSTSSFLKLKAQFFEFEEPIDRSIFNFLDLLADKDEKAYAQLPKLLDQFGDQYLLTMLFYLFRRQIVENPKMSPNVRARVERQRRNFPLERIEQLYKLALETDYKIKNGLIDGKNGMFLLVEEILKR